VWRHVAIRDPSLPQVSEIAGVKLDRDVNVVAFKDGREIPLPPGTGFLGSDGKVSQDTGYHHKHKQGKKL